MLNIPLQNKYEVDITQDGLGIAIPLLNVVLSYADALNLAAWIVVESCATSKIEDEFYATLEGIQKGIR